MRFQQYTRRLMKKYGFNQRKLAAALQMDTGQMSRFLDDEYPYRPSLVTLRLICTAFKCTPDERLELHRLADRVTPEIWEAFCSSAEMAKRIRAAARGDAVTPNTVPRELLMWAYARTKGADSIIGLHVCDDYLDWERELYAMAQPTRETV